MMKQPIQRIRGRRLQAIRERVLTGNPLCVACEAAGRVTAATQVDHIVALANHGADEETNLQGLCDECHRIKTAADLGYTLQSGCDDSGNPTAADHPWNR